MVAYVELAEVLEEVGAHQGEAFLQFDLEEEDCYRTLVLLLYTDPEAQMIVAELVFDVAVEKPEAYE